jgi:hypothetical protein
MTWPKPLRTVRSENGFDTELKELFPDPAARDELVLAPVDWALARNAEEFPIADDRTGVRIATLDPVTGPIVRVAFVIVDDDVVSLLSIRPLTTEDDDEEE